MPVKIRLMRIGARKRPFYRVVAIDERKKRTGQYIELLGTYNPLTKPKEMIFKDDRIKWWLEHGAVPSTGYLRIIGKAPQKPVRPPKKAKAKLDLAKIPVGETETALLSEQNPTEKAVEEQPVEGKTVAEQ